MSLVDCQEASKRRAEEIARDIRLGKRPPPKPNVIQSKPTAERGVLQSSSAGDGQKDSLRPPSADGLPSGQGCQPAQVSDPVQSKEDAIAGIKRGVSTLLTKLKDLQDQADDVEIALRLPSKAVILTVCKFYGILYREMISERRHQAIVIPRHIAMYLLKECTRKSYPEIGRAVGGRDHSTAMFGVKKISKLIETDPVLASDVAQIRSLLEPSNV